LIAIKLCFDSFVQKHDKVERQMIMAPTDHQGPAIRAPDPWALRRLAGGRMHQLLSDEERSRLAVIASIVRFKKGAEIYREGHRAEAVFNIISGVAKAYRCGPDGKEHIAAFLFPEDLFGLAQEGRYANSLKALTPVTAYRIPVAALRSRLTADAALEFHVIAKLCHELRQTQRHAFMLASRRALSKLTMFLQMLEQLQTTNGGSTNEIYVPMDRSDIAEYIGTTLAAVSRAFRTLTARGILQSRDRRHAKVIDRDAFEKLAGYANQDTLPGGADSART
jgi:CRP/FNR family transcriptional regulator